MLTSCIQFTKSQTAFLTERLVMATMETIFVHTCLGCFHGGAASLKPWLILVWSLFQLTLPSRQVTHQWALGIKQPPVAQPALGETVLKQTYSLHKRTLSSLHTFPSELPRNI